jgi:hypothetical protein
MEAKPQVSREIGVDEVRPAARIWQAWDLAPGTASAWVGTNSKGDQRVMIPVSREVAEAIGLRPSETSPGAFKPMARKLTNLPELLAPYAVLALIDSIRRPETHALATWVVAHR